MGKLSVNPSGKGWDAYRAKELKHWKNNGRGSGNYFKFKGQRWRLDRKAEAGKPPRYSPKSVEAKKGESRDTSTARDLGLKLTTLDPLATKAFGHSGIGGPIHHAVAAALGAKMHAQIELNQNPNWKPSDGATDTGKAFLRQLQNRQGLSTGDSPLNLRGYPADNPQFPSVSAVHTKAHSLQRKYGINPEQDFSGMTSDEIWRFAGKVKGAVQQIDEELGYKPSLQTPGEVGKSLRVNQYQNALTMPYMSKHDLTMRQTAPQGGFTPLPQTTAHGGGGYRPPLTSAKQGVTKLPDLPPISTGNHGDGLVPTVVNSVIDGLKVVAGVVGAFTGGMSPGYQAQKEKEKLEQMDIS